MSLRSKTETHDDRGEGAGTEQVADGVKTPPDRDCPNPPPPTPATPETALKPVEVLEVAKEEVNASLVPPTVEASKKKKKSGRNKKKKPPVNGFEGTVPASGSLF